MIDMDMVARACESVLPLGKKYTQRSWEPKFAQMLQWNESTISKPGGDAKQFSNRRRTIARPHMPQFLPKSIGSPLYQNGVCANIVSKTPTCTAIAFTAYFVYFAHHEGGNDLTL